MATMGASSRPRWLGFASWVLGVLGLVFYWWVPLGIVLALSGLLAGFIGWVAPRRRTGYTALFVTAMLFAAAVLAWDCLVAAWGIESVRFTALR